MVDASVQGVVAKPNPNANGRLLGIESEASSLFLSNHEFFSAQPRISIRRAFGAVEGLPSRHCKRATKVESLFNLVDSPDGRSSTLVSSPPQSGKTALSQLMLDYVIEQKPHLGVFYLSFKDFDESRQSLDQFFQTFASNYSNLCA